MERSTASLTYKGSISDAIGEAQTQRKLFVVYISGDDENWLTWEQSIFKEPSVAESISKYCVFLQLMQGSLDASQFSAIYPQKSIPSMSVVGYSGALLWNDGCLRASGGYLDARDFVNKIHEAWATLHLQETAATVSSAALSSQSHNVASLDSSCSNDPSNSAEKPTEHSQHEQLADPKKSVNQSVCETGNEEKDTKQGKEKYAQSGTIQDREEQSKSATNTSKQVLCSVSRDVDDSVICNDGDVSMEIQENILSDESHTKTSETAKGTATCSPTSSHITINEVEEKREAKNGDGQVDCPKTSMNQSESHTKTSETAEEMAKSSAGSSQISANKVEKRIEAKKGDGPTDDSTVLKSTDIHLNIRMPNGTAIQATFRKADTLFSVRNYIDENQTSGTDTYDLAVPYPRKVFNEQDMSSCLSELGFARRQSLIVVPRRPRGPSLNEGGTDSRSNTGGYFQHVKRLLSYVNPLSYLGGNANSSSSVANLWQYQPNPALQNQPSSNPALQNQVSSNPRTNPRGRASRPFGSNIHTLNDTEDEGPSGDKNMFWNGNSTQYGGNDNN